MAYGFILNLSGGIVHLEDTFSGIGRGQNVVEINGQYIVGNSKSGVQSLLDNIRLTKGNIEFLLSSGEIITFFPNSAPFGWNNQKVSENA